MFHDSDALGAVVFAGAFFRAGFLAAGFLAVGFAFFAGAFATKGRQRYSPVAARSASISDDEGSTNAMP